MDTIGSTISIGGESNADVISTNTELETPVTTQTDGSQATDSTDTTQELGADGQPLESGKEGDKGKGVADGKEDGRVIPPWMRVLKETNPEAFNKAKTDLFELRDRRSVHPTPQAAREEHDLVLSLGGAKGIATMREDAGVFKTAASQFLKGDPAFVKDLWDEDPIAAVQHVQPFLTEFKARDFEGYRTTIAKLWQNDFQQVGFEAGLNALMDAIKRKDFDAASAIVSGPKDSFKSWYDSIMGVANRAEDPRVKTLLAERNKARENEQTQAQQTFLKEYRTDAANTVLEEASKVFESYFRGRKLDDEDRQSLLQDAVKVANGVVAADAKFMADRQAHLDAGDKHSALRVTRARFAEAMPDAVKKIARRYGMSSQTAPNQPQNQNGKGNQNQSGVEQGWKAVTQRPDPISIDRTRTEDSMILAGRAILKDGSKVDWSALKRQNK
jgi:hypothetical protein